MKSKVNQISKLSVILVGLFLLNLVFAGCSKKDSTGSVDNLPNITGYPIVGSNQTMSYDTSRIIGTPVPGQAYYGQNSNYPGHVPSYTSNGDGTVTDNVTGLMWQQTEDRNGDGVINFYDKITCSEALADVATCNTGGHHDWRLPTIKELYSLVMSSGTDMNPQSPSPPLPYINTDYFGFGYGDTNSLAHGDLGRERPIDAQVVTSTLYVSTTMNGIECMFGYNFADGRIKAYPTTHTVPEDGQAKHFYVLYVRGNSNYGKNNFQDNGDSTVTDNATRLMWAKNDSHGGMNWEAALAWVQTKNQANYCGHNDWRLPDIKELHSIVDYTRSPATTNQLLIRFLIAPGLSTKVAVLIFPGTGAVLLFVRDQLQMEHLPAIYVSEGQWVISLDSGLMFTGPELSVPILKGEASVLLLMWETDTTILRLHRAMQ